MEWISVKDRLPKVNDIGTSEEVLIIDSRKKCNIAFYDAKNIWCDDFWDDLEPTHWMPLPEPPKE